MATTIATATAAAQTESNEFNLRIQMQYTLEMFANKFPGNSEPDRILFLFSFFFLPFPIAINLLPFCGTLTKFNE